MIELMIDCVIRACSRGLSSNVWECLQYFCHGEDGCSPVEIGMISVWRRRCWS